MPTGDSSAAVASAPRERLDPRSQHGVSGFLRQLTEAGWTLGAPAATAPAGISLCLVARPPPGRARAPGAHLLYVYRGDNALCVDDLWRIATDARTSACAHAVMLLTPDVTIPTSLRGAAARLNVRILRLAT